MRDAGQSGIIIIIIIIIMITIMMMITLFPPKFEDYHIDKNKHQSILYVQEKVPQIIT